MSPQSKSEVTWNLKTLCTLLSSWTLNGGLLKWDVTAPILHTQFNTDLFADLVESWHSGRNWACWRSQTWGRLSCDLQLQPTPILPHSPGFQGPYHVPGMKYKLWAHWLLPTAVSTAGAVPIFHCVPACCPSEKAKSLPKKVMAKDRYLTSLVSRGIQRTAKVILWKKVEISIQFLPTMVSQQIPLTGWL